MGTGTRRTTRKTDGRPSQPLPRAPGVLVVEDDPDQQWRLARMLTVDGSRVVATSSAEGAVALLREWPADVVLLDDELGGTSGIDVARRIHALRPRLPIVLMTSDGGAHVERTAENAGVAACLHKPFGREALWGVLGTVRRAGRRSAGRVE
ncbi:MAG: response regulator [Myxococcota bacterium]|nr:response regulator [Myxococcota bacterium]MDW8360906.1 response regulator [Myxococcales bacterium]